jgi:hypothetical protein
MKEERFYPLKPQEGDRLATEMDGHKPSGRRDK